MKHILNSIGILLYKNIKIVLFLSKEGFTNGLDEEFLIV